MSAGTPAGGWFAVALAYVSQDPVRSRSALQTVLDETLGALNAQPAKLQASTVRSRRGRPRSFSEKNLEAVLDEEDAGEVTIFGLKKSEAQFTLHLHLSHNPSIERKYRPPGVLYCIEECGAKALLSAQVTTSCSAFLSACASGLKVLHGGITAVPTLDQALSEASLIGFDLNREPAEFVTRWTYDAKHATDLWARARHVYWTTLLGPSLAERVSKPIPATAHVTDVKGSLIIRTSEQLEDALKPEFTRETQALTQWLWPQLIQNPADQR